MPLVEITVPAGALEEDSLSALQRDVADSVLKWMGLPHDDFFRSATWVYVNEVPAGRSTTGAGDTGPRFLVVVTALEKFLTAESNEAMAGEITEFVLKAAGLPADKAGAVWTVVHEVPEGNWAVGSNLTRRKNIDALIAQSKG
jgi:phenylpyruvate tautomerase PptA (4-oxalocrotonate tautomerase family)